jgi:hypothetical protein
MIICNTYSVLGSNNFTWLLTVHESNMLAYELNQMLLLDYKFILFK